MLSKGMNSFVREALDRPDWKFLIKEMPLADTPLLMM